MFGMGGDFLLDDTTYNLMMQLIKEMQSVWRIENNYIKDTEGCEDCTIFWKKLLEHKLSHINELEELVGKRINKINKEKIKQINIA
jgi:hypothetical protein